MKNIMKEMLVFGLQAKVDNETFVKRISYLLDDNMLELLCNGTPCEILAYDANKIKETLEPYGYETDLEINGVELTNEPYRPVRVKYTANSVRYFSSQEDADKAEKDGNRYAGKSMATDSHSISRTIRYSSTADLSLDNANQCCVFSKI